MSQTYISVAVNLLVMFAPKFGLTVGSEELTLLIQQGVALVTGIWILVRRWQAGGVNIAGFRTE